MESSGKTKSFRELVGVYFNRRMAALLALGFASGLPLAMTGDTLQAWMTESNIDLGTIGIFSLVTLPYTLKFLWSPLMDRYVPPLLGRRRGWLLLTQLLLIGAMAGMGLVGPSASLITFAWMALFVAFLSASQDIVFDAYRTDVLPEAERGTGAAVSVMGYRLAMIASGAVALWISVYLPWPIVYCIVAAAMGVGVIATIFAPEPLFNAPPPPTLGDAVVRPFMEFFSRAGGVLVLLFIVVFKLPDVMAASMTMPFMLDIGIDKADIAAVRQGLGMYITIVGTLAGGGIVAGLGLWPSLWVFGFLQALSNLGFLVLAQTGDHYPTMVSVIALESFCGGLVTAGFVAFLMSQCNHRFTATQFALLSSLMALTRVLGGTPSGYVAQTVGWSWFFGITVLAAFPGLLLLVWVRPSRTAPGEPRGFEVELAGISSSRD